MTDTTSRLPAHPDDTARAYYLLGALIDAAAGLSPAARREYLAALQRKAEASPEADRQALRALIDEMGTDAAQHLARPSS